MTPYTAVKCFSATKARDREVLGERVTEWLRDPAQRGVEVVDKAVRSSSDREFHCVSITLFFRRAGEVKFETGGAGEVGFDTGEQYRRSWSGPRRTRSKE